VSVSPFRQLVIDLMHFSRKVPAVTAHRQMDLGPLIAVRQRAAARPNWTVLFTKAFAILGRDYPELRRAFMPWPWSHFYEHPHNVVALNVERRLPGEDIVLFCLIRSPENRPLAEIEAIVREHKQAPIETLRSYQRAIGVSRIPWPFRRWFWWASLNIFGRRRCHNFGTYSVTSIASQGAGLLHVVPLLPCSLYYGLFDHERLDVRLTWDHRVMDGATVARALTDLETILNREIAQELAGAARSAA
jgi:hypothetical protein